MKTLFLIRHADSTWNDQLLNDHERPLNKRGIEDAPKMGELLNANYAAPEKILCSTALRAKQTANAIQAKWFPQQKVEFNVQLYEETTSTILDIIHSTNQKINRIALFFHNPSITYLTNILTSLSIPDIPTCGVAILESEVKNWKHLEVGSCNLLNFEYPEKKKEA
jgi:phosphohistidine phosphatase